MISVNRLALLLTLPRCFSLAATPDPKDKISIEITSFFSKDLDLDVDDAHNAYEAVNGLNSDFVLGAVTLPDLLTERYVAFDNNEAFYLKSEWSVVEQGTIDSIENIDKSVWARLRMNSNTATTACVFMSDWGDNPTNEKTAATTTQAAKLDNKIKSVCKSSDVVLFMFPFGVPNAVASYLKGIGGVQSSAMSDLQQVSAGIAQPLVSDYADHVLVRLPTGSCLNDAFAVATHTLFTQICQGTACPCAAVAGKSDQATGKTGTKDSNGHLSAGWITLIVLSSVGAGIGALLLAHRNKRAFLPRSPKQEKVTDSSAPVVLGGDDKK